MARLSHVLVIDGDPKGLQTVAFGFEREGCRVTAASSADAGLSSMQSARPDAVVLALRQGPDAGRFILEGLTAGQNLPVVVLGSEEHRRAVAQNHADFLPIPAFLRDIITATRLRAATRAGDGKDAVVQGALSEYGLFFLLRTFLALRTSAVVQIERANRRGELRFSKGELRSAQVGTVTGAPALNQLLLWEEAAMEIRFRPVTARSQFNNKGAAQIEEAERFLRDFAHTARTLGSAQTVYEAAANDRQDAQTDVAPVLRLFDGQRSVADVLDESPFRVFDTLRIISRLVDTESIRKKDGVPTRPLVSTSAASPLMESWLRGEAEVVERDAPVAPMPQAARGGQTGPLPAPSDQAAVPVAPTQANGRAAHAPVASQIQNTLPGPKQTSAGGSLASPQATRGELVARTSAEDKAIHQRPSMVIDLPQEVLETSPTQLPPEVPPLRIPAAVTANPFAPPTPAPVSPPIALVLPASVSPRTTGSLEVRGARGAKHTPRPTGSIELDPALMAEMESAAPPKAPPVRASPQVVSRPKTKSVPPVTAKTRTGEFDQLEKDFFAREAELYKSDKPDSFDDLE